MKKILWALLLCMTGSALAHHSPAVFDRTKQLKLAGVVKEFRWNNPHSWIERSLVGRDGTADVPRQGGLEINHDQARR
jgi:hypothetical protein